MMEQKKIKQKLNEGYIHIRAILEIVGKPKKYVEDSLKEHMDKIKSDENFIIIEESLEKAQEQENFFSAFGDIELLVKDSPGLLSLCFDYMPSSIEILEPEQISLKNNEFSGFLNDLQSRLLTLNTGIIQTRQANKIYIQNMAVLLRNFIVVLLSRNSRTIDEMVPFLGVKKTDIEKVVNVLVNEGKVKKDGNRFIVIPKK